MPKFLVAYYSWTGNTEKVAKLIAETLSADIERIVEVEPRGGFFAFPAAVVDSLLKKSPPILQTTKNVADYDVVILGCPVWASNMATPMRTFILQERLKIKQVALFCTLGGSGGKATLGRMATLCGRASLADLIVNATATYSGDWRGSSENFARQVQTQQAQKSGVSSHGQAAT
ncbi:FldA Flavodoxins [Rhabdaerophilaceae bacterium]